MKKKISPLEALERMTLFVEGCDLCDEYDIIEKALKDCEEAKKINNILKEVIQFGRTLPEIKPNNKNGFDILQSVGLRVQRDIENEERKQLREWVLKTCFPKELADYEKKSKVLEIIKEKRVILFDFDRCKTVEEYNDKVKNLTYAKKLTKEQFNLLKEVLK